MDATLNEQHDELQASKGQVDRRRMLGGAAAAGVGLTALSACGSATSGAATSGSQSSGAGSGASSTGASAEGGTAVAAADIPVGGGKILSNAKVVVTQPTAGTYKAFSAICTHQGCLVGAVQYKKIICPCHGSEFSITDGSVEQGPATEPLPTKNVTASGTNLTVS